MLWKDKDGEYYDIIKCIYITITKDKTIVKITHDSILSLNGSYLFDLKKKHSPDYIQKLKDSLTPQEYNDLHVEYRLAPVRVIHNANPYGNYLY